MCGSELLLSRCKRRGVAQEKERRTRLPPRHEVLVVTNFEGLEKLSSMKDGCSVSQYPNAALGRSFAFRPPFLGAR